MPGGPTAAFLQTIVYWREDRRTTAYRRLVVLGDVLGASPRVFRAEGGDGLGRVATFLLPLVQKGSELEVGGWAGAGDKEGCQRDTVGGAVSLLLPTGGS